MLNLPLLILAHCFELACSLACVLLTGTLLNNKTFYLFFQRRLYERIEEMWDFYESHPVVSLCFYFSYSLLIFKWPSQNRELFGLYNNWCTGTRPFLYPAGCARWCDFEHRLQRTKNVNKYCTCVRGNNWTILDEASGNLEGSYLKTCNVYKHKMLWFLLSSKETSAPSLCLLLTLGIQWMGRWEPA